MHSMQSVVFLEASEVKGSWAKGADLRARNPVLSLLERLLEEVVHAKHARLVLTLQIVKGLLGREE